MRAYHNTAVRADDINTQLFDCLSKARQQYSPRHLTRVWAIYYNWAIRDFGVNCVDRLLRRGHQEMVQPTSKNNITHCNRTDVSLLNSEGTRVKITSTPQLLFTTLINIWKMTGFDYYHTSPSQFTCLYASVKNKVRMTYKMIECKWRMA